MDTSLAHSYIDPKKYLTLYNNYPYNTDTSVDLCRLVPVSKEFLLRFLIPFQT